MSNKSSKGSSAANTWPSPSSSQSTSNSSVDGEAAGPNVGVNPDDGSDATGTGVRAWVGGGGAATTPDDTGPGEESGAGCSSGTSVTVGVADDKFNDSMTPATSLLSSWSGTGRFAPAEKS